MGRQSWDPSRPGSLPDESDEPRATVPHKSHSHARQERKSISLYGYFQHSGRFCARVYYMRIARGMHHFKLELMGNGGPASSPVLEQCSLIGAPRCG